MAPILGSPRVAVTASIKGDSSSGAPAYFVFLVYPHGLIHLGMRVLVSLVVAAFGPSGADQPLQRPDFARDLVDQRRSSRAPIRGRVSACSVVA